MNKLCMCSIIVVSGLIIPLGFQKALADSKTSYGIEIRPSVGIEGEGSPNAAGIACEMRLSDRWFSIAEGARSQTDFTQFGVNTRMVSQSAKAGMRYYLKGLVGLYADTTLGIERAETTFFEKSTTQTRVTSAPLTFETGYRILVGPFSSRVGVRAGRNFVLSKQVQGDGPNVQVNDANISQITAGFGYLF